MKYWSLYDLYNIYVGNLLVRYFCIIDIYLSRSIYVNNNDILCTSLFMIIIRVSVHLSSLSNIIIIDIYLTQSINNFDAHKPNL